ncbi:hypothetical protein ACLOJK_029110 [Asimina triloba]
MAVGTRVSRQDTNKVHTDVLAEARNSCYKARDFFYACIEKESMKTPTEIASVGLLYPAECKKTRETFVKMCRLTWYQYQCCCCGSGAVDLMNQACPLKLKVKHFDRQYCAKKRVQRLLDDSDESRKVSVHHHPPPTHAKKDVDVLLHKGSQSGEQAMACPCG